MNIDYTNPIDTEINRISSTDLSQSYYKNYSVGSWIFKSSLILSLAASPLNVNSSEPFNNNSNIECFEMMPSYNQNPVRVNRRVKSRYNKSGYLTEQKWTEYFNSLPDSPMSGNPLGSEKDFIQANHAKFPSNIEK